MGGESSILRDCEWDEEEKSYVNGDWNLRSVTLRDETRATVFQEIRRDRKQKNLLTQASNKLKSLRHPSLVRYLASGTSSDGAYLVTEHVTPVSSLLPLLSAIEVAAGLYNIIEAMVFLHDKVGTAHNNLCVEALYVGGDGCWRLGGLEHSCPFSQATPTFLESCRALRCQESLAPEEKNGTVKMGNDIAHSRDAYAFGIVVEQLIEKLDELGDMTKTFTLRIQDEFLNVDPRKRPTFASLLQDCLFKNDFLDIVQFLKNITMTTEKEKEDFFSSVTSKLLRLPEELLARRLAAPLLSRFTLLDKTADRLVVPALLRPYTGAKRPQPVPGEVTPILHMELFRQHVVPLLLRIFHVRDSHIRLTLLAHFPSYVSAFSPEELQDTIFPQLLLGLRDCNDRIVAASLRGLAELVPLLGGDVVIGGTRKKFFSEGMPKFGRTIKAETEGSQRNVAGVLGKKILLKDLASMSNGALRAEEEKQRRQREREQRREEARQRREEKKRQEQERKRQQQQEEERETAAERIASSGADPHQGLGEGEREGEGEGEGEGEREGEGEGEGGQPGKVQTSPVVRVAAGKDHDSEGLDSHGSEEEEEEAQSQEEWSDWEDADESSRAGTTEGRMPADVEVDESAISDEIERELELMEGDEKPSKKSSKPSTPTSKTGHISDSGHDHSSRRASVGSDRKLSSSRFESTSPHPREGHSMEFDAHTTEDGARSSISPRSADSRSQAPSKSSSAMKLGSKKPPTKSGSAASKTAPAGTQGKDAAAKLGAEFDVKAVEIKRQTSTEVDFFADMAPAIKVEEGDPLLKMLETVVASSSSAAEGEKSKTAPSLSFAVKADADAAVAQEGEAGGWDAGGDDW